MQGAMLSCVYWTLRAEALSLRISEAHHELKRISHITIPTLQLPDTI